MTNITIRNLDNDGKTRLRLRDAVNVRPTAPRDLAEFTRECFACLGGVEFELPPRGPMREPPDFS
ncbi:MAG: plasmid stabilization protein [Gammaproteobacteria bacterium]|nr:plasmid stabilization protein [Gammaproteobacteria bacterium]